MMDKEVEAEKEYDEKLEKEKEKDEDEHGKIAIRRGRRTGGYRRKREKE